MLAAGGLAACDNEDPNEDGHFYCTDPNGVVVDEDYCDDSSSNFNSGFFIYYLGTSIHTPPSGYASYPTGTKLPPQAAKFSVTDKSARTKFGLPPSGRVSNGTVKTGVVGKGGAGSGAKAGAGGSGKGGSGGG